VPHPEVTLATKLEFLRRADSYPHRPDDVELIETHFACLFLAGPLVYKLKKPIRFHEIDFTTVDLRRANCDYELKLNRRLAAAIYIDVVPLSMADSGLVLETQDRGPVVDWLVKMHRLPRERMLDARAAAGPVGSDELRKLIAKLAAFYSRTSRAPWDGAQYRLHLERHIRAQGEQLLTYRSLLGAGRIESVVAAELASLRTGTAAFEARCTRGRVVDAHGDLRPEHILLGDEPQVIDCLEFSAELRLLDTAEEIAFLALECTQLGRADLAREVVAIYRELCDDPVPERLFDFYYVRRALVRALLCAWHLGEPLSEPLRHHWRERAKTYLEAALAAIARTL